MNLDDLLALIATATPEQLKVLRETVAPVTKLQRLQEEATALANRVNTATIKVNDEVSRFANKVNNGDLSAIPPTWEELVALFQGP